MATSLVNLAISQPAGNRQHELSYANVHRNAVKLKEHVCIPVVILVLGRSDIKTLAFTCNNASVWTQIVRSENVTVSKKIIRFIKSLGTRVQSEPGNVSTYVCICLCDVLRRISNVRNFLGLVVYIKTHVRQVAHTISNLKRCACIHRQACEHMADRQLHAAFACVFP